MSESGNPAFVRFTNGDFDMATGELKGYIPGSPLLELNTIYDVDNPAPTWEATMSQIVGDSTEVQGKFTAAIMGLCFGDPQLWDAFEGAFKGDKELLLWFRDITLDIVGERIRK